VIRILDIVSLPPLRMLRIARRTGPLPLCLCASTAVLVQRSILYPPQYFAYTHAPAARR